MICCRVSSRAFILRLVLSMDKAEARQLVRLLGFLDEHRSHVVLKSLKLHLEVVDFRGLLGQGFLVLLIQLVDESSLLVHDLLSLLRNL